MQANAQVNEEPMDLHSGFFAREELVSFSSCYLNTFWPSRSESAVIKISHTIGDQDLNQVQRRNHLTLIKFL